MKQQWPLFSETTTKVHSKQNSINCISVKETAFIVKKKLFYKEIPDSHNFNTKFYTNLKKNTKHAQISPDN